MPIRYVIDKEQRLVVVTLSGRVTARDIRACIDQGLRDTSMSDMEIYRQSSPNNELVGPMVMP